jgi:hypothetical protein
VRLLVKIEAVLAQHEVRRLMAKGGLVPLRDGLLCLVDPGEDYPPALYHTYGEEWPRHARRLLDMRHAVPYPHGGVGFRNDRGAVVCWREPEDNPGSYYQPCWLFVAAGAGWALRHGWVPPGPFGGLAQLAETAMDESD